MNDTQRGGMNQPRCPNCGRYCGVVIRYRGPSLVDLPSCDYCGLNPPHCTFEDGSAYGCQNNATHVVEGANLGLYWCDGHAPDDAEPMPYVEREVDAGTNRSGGE